MMTGNSFRASPNSWLGRTASNPTMAQETNDIWLVIYSLS